MATKFPKWVAQPWIHERHVVALRGTGFERCAGCYGTSGKVEGGKMACARAGAIPVPVTVAQAAACTGKKPHLEKKEEIPSPSGIIAANAAVLCK